MDKQELLQSLQLELRRGIIVLSVLSQLGTPKYGYHLIRILAQHGLSVEANTLYPLLRRLEGQGMLQSEWRTEGNKPRKYYLRTKQGNEMYLLLQRQWQETVQSMNGLMEGEAL